MKDVYEQDERKPALATAPSSPWTGRSEADGVSTKWAEAFLSEPHGKDLTLAGQGRVKGHPSHSPPPLSSLPPIACSALLPSSFLLVSQKRKVEGLESTQDIQNQRNGHDPGYTSTADKGSKGE